MKSVNGILALALLAMFACDPDDSNVSPQGLDQNSGNGQTLSGSEAVSSSAQNVLEIGSRMQELESFGFGRPSILSQGFGFAATSEVFASGRVRDEDGDEDNEDWEDEDWELDEETLALLEQIELLEQGLDSLEVQLDSTEDPDQREALETSIDELHEELEALEEALDDIIEEFEEEHGEFYIEECDYTTCAQEEFMENPDGSYSWVIDYGNGCEEHDGTVLTGKITETFTENGNSFSGTIVYENFGEEDYLVSGTETFSGSFEGEEDTESFRGSYTYSESLQVTIDGETFNITISGTESFDSLGYSWEGTERYETSSGDFAETRITTPLYFSLECEDDDVFEPVSGIEETTWQEGNESGSFVIDFGSGTCDNIITITEDGETYQIDLEEEDWEDDEDEDDDEGDDDEG